jgi:oligoendopeptidase F
LAEASPAERVSILEIQLCGATQVCLDISSRFLFESAIFQKRAEAELGPEEICDLMLAAQRETYGDAIVPETYHPYMWLWKPHYYQHAGNFYNFPYAFGHLFALGLYAIYQHEGPDFVDEYRQLLRDTGRAHAAPLAARFGLDITQPEFWRGSLNIIADQLLRYEAA